MPWMPRIVFLGTPDFAVPILRQLITSATVVGVVTQPDRPAGRGRRVQAPPVKGVAEAAAIPVYQPPSLRSEESAAPLRAWQPDMIVVAAFGQLLRPHILELPSWGCLNVHASLLPRWRGASPIQHAILAGDHHSGVSLMRMDVGLDTGPVYAQQAIPIAARESAGSLHDRLAVLGAEMIAAHLEAIYQGRLLAQPQDDSQSTYAPMIKKEAGWLDWRRSAIELDRQVRAMTPWPGAMTSWRGEPLKIIAAEPLATAERPAGPPGLVVEHDGELVVLAGEGGLALRQLQLPGKRPVAAADFARGRPDFVRAMLTNREAVGG
jgi:methionyl-tRNA formyltransferase